MNVRVMMLGIQSAACAYTGDSATSGSLLWDFCRQTHDFSAFNVENTEHKPGLGNELQIEQIGMYLQSTM